MKKRMTRFIPLLMLMAALCLFPAYTHAAAKKMSLQWKTSKRTVEKGKKLTLKVKIRNKKRGSRLSWTSSARKIATVSKKGVVSGKKAGKVKITVKIRGTRIKRSCQIRVVNPAKTQIPSAAPTPKQTTVPGTKPVTPAVSPSVKPVTPAVTPTAPPAATPVYTPPADELIPYSGVMDIGGETMTVYLINRNYSGPVHVRMNGKEFSTEGTAKDALLVLASSGTTRENSAGTIRISRSKDAVNGGLMEYWTVEDLELGLSYQMKAEMKTSIKPEIANCGAIYFRGDVTSAIEVY